MAFLASTRLTRKVLLDGCGRELGRGSGAGDGRGGRGRRGAQGDERAAGRTDARVLAVPRPGEARSASGLGKELIKSQQGRKDSAGSASAGARGKQDVSGAWGAREGPPAGLCGDRVQQTRRRSQRGKGGGPGTLPSRLAPPSQTRTRALTISPRAV